MKGKGLRTTLIIPTVTCSKTLQTLKGKFCIRDQGLLPPPMIVTMVILFHNTLIILHPAETEVQRARLCRSESAVPSMQNNSWVCFKRVMRCSTISYRAFNCPVAQNYSNYWMGINGEHWRVIRLKCWAWAEHHVLMDVSHSGFYFVLGYAFLQDWRVIPTVSISC